MTSFLGNICKTISGLKVEEERCSNVRLMSSVYRGRYFIFKAGKAQKLSLLAHERASVNALLNAMEVICIMSVLEIKKRTSEIQGLT